MWFAAFGLVPAFIWLVNRHNPSATMRAFATFCALQAMTWVVFGLYVQVYLCPTAPDHPACIGE